MKTNTIAGGADRLLLSLNGPHAELTIETVTSFKLSVPVAYTHSDNVVTNGPVHDLCHLTPWVERDNPVGIMFADAYFNVPIDFQQATAPHIWTTTLPSEADASQYGQVVTEGNKVQALYEKPATEHSRVILTGAMKLPFDVFARARHLCASADHELHLGHVIETYVADGILDHTLLSTGSFIDCGNAQSWQQAHDDRRQRL